MDFYNVKIVHIFNFYIHTNSCIILQMAFNYNVPFFLFIAIILQQSYGQNCGGHGIKGLISNGRDVENDFEAPWLVYIRSSEKQFGLNIIRTMF